MKNCGNHFRLSSRRRLKQIVDEGAFEEFDLKNAQVKYKETIEISGSYMSIDEALPILKRAFNDRSSDLMHLSEQRMIFGKKRDELKEPLTLGDILTYQSSKNGKKKFGYRYNLPSVQQICVNI